MVLRGAIPLTRLGHGTKVPYADGHFGTMYFSAAFAYEKLVSPARPMITSNPNEGEKTINLNHPMKITLSFLFAIAILTAPTLQRRRPILRQIRAGRDNARTNRGAWFITSPRSMLGQILRSSPSAWLFP